MTERKGTSFGDISLRWDRDKEPALDNGDTGIHSVDAANGILRIIEAAHKRAEDSLGKAAESLMVSITDKMTGCLNQNFWDMYKEEFFNPGRDDGQVGILFADLNNLKQTNDNISYDAGDDLIKNFGKLLKANVRKGDLVIRWGGDEFIVICRSNGENVNFAQELAAAIEERAAAHPTVDVATGVAIYNKAQDELDLGKTKNRASEIMKENKSRMRVKYERP